LSAVLVLAAVPADAQSLYKYKGKDGEWIYTDRQPPDDTAAEVRSLPNAGKPATVTVSSRVVDGNFELYGDNEFHAPVEIVIALDEMTNLVAPGPAQPMRWVVEPQSSQQLLVLAPLDSGEAVSASYRYIWLPGDPTQTADKTHLYRAPFAVASSHPVTQAFPDAITHQTPDSYYALDIAMPIGTDVHAARAGVVFEVASTNFRGGADRAQNGASANIVRILHDDGSHAVYAHLNWNSIRVRPGDRVERGEYIADSGNTGFSTGPHLHFAVLVNEGMRLVSLPVQFEGAAASRTTPKRGDALGAY